MKKERELITQDEAIKRYGVTRNTLYVWRSEGMPWYQKVGRFVYYDPKEVEKWLNERYEPKKIN